MAEGFLESSSWAGVRQAKKVREMSVLTMHDELIKRGVEEASRRGSAPLQCKLRSPLAALFLVTAPGVSAQPAQAENEPVPARLIDKG